MQVQSHNVTMLAATAGLSRCGYQGKPVAVSTCSGPRSRTNCCSSRLRTKMLPANATELQLQGGQQSGMLTEHTLLRMRVGQREQPQAPGLAHHAHLTGPSASRRRGATSMNSRVQTAGWVAPGRSNGT